MPELPEIEIVKRSLYKMINKAKITSITINNKNLRYKIASNFSQSLKGEKIIKITRRSKYLIFFLKTKLILIHLGMTGKLLIIRNRDNATFRTSFYYNLNIISKHNHIIFKLNNGLMLIYNDVRRFGFLKIYKISEINKISFLKKLGLEPLNDKFNIKYFKKFSLKRKKNIKNLIMDQTFICGLGNIYANEALFMSKIKPFRECNNLNDVEIKNLILSIKRVLKLSISKGGSSIRDFISSSGKSGQFQQFFQVYGRKNKSCSRTLCKGIIKKINISNRSSFYCNICQS